MALLTSLRSMKPSPFWSYFENCADTFSLAAASAFEIFPSLLASSDSKVVPCCEGCEGCVSRSGVCAMAAASGRRAAAAPAISSLVDFMSSPLFG